MNIIQKKSPNQEEGRKGWKPDIIVCHITDGNFEGAVSWLCNSASKASAHFVVSRKGEITQLVDLKNTGWANGTATNASDKRYYGKSTLKSVRDRKTNANYYTVSIETEGFSTTTKGALTDIQKIAIIELIKHIRLEIKKIYGIDIPIDRQHIVGHYEITPITKPNCPGKLFPFDEIITQLNIKEVIINGDDEMVEKSKFQIDGKVYDMDRILKDNINYIKVADLKQAGFDISYDKSNNLPVINSPKN